MHHSLPASQQASQLVPRLVPQPAQQPVLQLPQTPQPTNPPVLRNNDVRSKPQSQPEIVQPELTSYKNNLYNTNIPNNLNGYERSISRASDRHSSKDFWEPINF